MWEHFSAVISTAELEQRLTLPLLKRPVELSLFDPVQGTGVDLRDVKLVDTSGQEALANGDFSHGVERWFFTDDDHLVWRMKNQYAMMLFEGGMLGLLSFLMLSGVALFGAVHAIRGKQLLGAPIMASIAAFLFSSLFDYLFEAPRIATLFYLVCFVGVTMLYNGAGRRRFPPVARIGKAFE
jgi:hypothetical protein